MYIINKTDGTEIDVILDGVVSTATDLNLIGKNVPNYGELLNENLVKLLENFANSSPPVKPLVGELWYDTSSHSLKVYDESTWRNAGAATVSSKFETPTNPGPGTFWFNTTTQQLLVYDTEYKPVGPEAADGFSITRLKSTVVQDSDGIKRPVILGYIDNVVLFVISAGVFNTADIPGFTNIQPGINLSEVSPVIGRLQGNADTATKLKTPRIINDATFDGTADITITARTTNPLIRGNYLIGNDFDGDTQETWSVNASPLSLANTVVSRDEFGNFNAREITAALRGNVTGNLTGNVTGTLVGNSVGSHKGFLSANDESISFNPTTKKFFGSFEGNVTGNVTGNITGNVVGNLTGNSSTATKLQTSRAINNSVFDGTADIVITAETPNVLTRGTYLTGNDFNGSANTTWAVDATSASQANKVVARDAAGNFSANIITSSLSGNVVGNVTGNVTGNASTATKLQTGRTINNVVFDGSSDIVIKSETPYTLTRGGYLLGNNFNGNIATTWDVDASTEAIPNKVVARDAQGNFKANIVYSTVSGNLIGSVQGNVTGNLTGNVTGNVRGDLVGNVTGNVTGTVVGNLVGNASTATKLQTARAINGVLFDGTADITIPTYVRAWVKFRGYNGSILKSYNVTSVVKTAAGRYTINILPGVFSNNQYVVAGSASDLDHILSTASTYVGGSSTPTQLFVSTVDISSPNDTTSDSAEVSVMLIGSPYVAGEADIVEAVGQAQFLSPGTYNWTVPAGVTYVSAVAIGGGGGGGQVGGSYGGSGGGGGACAYANDIPVSAGETLTIVVGAAGSPSGAGGTTTILKGNSGIVTAIGGQAGNSNGAVAAGGTYSHNGALIDGSYGGWNGGFGGRSYGSYGQRGGDGTGAGYIGSAGGGSGGHPGGGTEQDGGNGAVGAIGGGQGGNNNTHSGAGGGGGCVGQGYPGFNGLLGNGSTGGNGGRYGGGGGGGSHSSGGGLGAHGAARLIWGSFRAFPGLTTQDL